MKSDPRILWLGFSLMAIFIFLNCQKSFDPILVSESAKPDDNPILITVDKPVYKPGETIKFAIVNQGNVPVYCWQCDDFGLQLRI